VAEADQSDRTERAVVIDLKCPKCEHPQAVISTANPDPSVEDIDGEVVWREGGSVELTIECADCDFNVRFGALEVS
jgi:ssDNA-binding Zn-finger/Zn-ribbon topoisomerase 1